MAFFPRFIVSDCIKASLTDYNKTLDKYPIPFYNKINPNTKERNTNIMEKFIEFIKSQDNEVTWLSFFALLLAIAPKHL